MKITILGCGRWGTFLAYYLQEINHEILLWGRSSSEKMKKLSIDKKNDYLTLPENVILSTSLKDALNFSQFIIIAINPHNLQSLVDIISTESYKDKTFITCMKGFDETGERISTVLAKNFSSEIKIVSLTGAGQPQDLINKMPTCMLVDSNDENVKKDVAQIFESDLISIHIGNDLIGSEIGSAAKNVLGIGSGILEALGFRSLIGSLVVFGLNEIAELIFKSGGKKDTVYGLSCLGDIEATFFSPHSRSRNAGISIVNNVEAETFVPGFYTSETILKMAGSYKITMPLFTTTNQIIKKELESYDLIKCIMQYNKLGFNMEEIKYEN
jgi:glycerol-3-phosphate dehydrogenase (NAD(P)+)